MDHNSKNNLLIKEDENIFTTLSRVSSGSRYWTPQIQSYVNRVEAEDGIIDDKAVMKAEIDPALPYLDKVDLWINPIFGKINPLTVPLTPSVFFTFDDCAADIYDNMFPAFKSRGIKATMFIASSPIYIAEDLPRINFAPVGNRMIWPEVVEMAADWDLEDHSYSHDPNYTARTRIEKESDLDLVDAIWIAHGLGLPKHFAYPGGVEDLFAWKILSNRGRKLKRNTASIAMTYSAIGLSQIPVKSFIQFADSNVTTFKSAINLAKLLNQAVGFISHNISAGSDTSHYLEVVDHAITEGVPILTFEELDTKINKIRGKYFSVVENNLFLNDMFEYSPIVTKRIYFNDTLANITATVANDYVAKGYEVGFMEDRTDAALAYVVPNSSFRTALHATHLSSGINAISIGTGAKITHLDTYMKTYTNGYVTRWLTGRRIMTGRYDNGVYTALSDVTVSSAVITDWYSSFAFEMILNAGHVEVWIKGTKVVDIADATYANGNILITSGVGSQINLNAIEITNFHDSGGLTDTFTDPDASELNYINYESNISDGLIKYESGKLTLEPIMGVNGYGCLGIERIGTFTGFGTVMKFITGARNNLRRIIEAGGNASVIFDYSGKSISGSIAECGLHLLKNTNILYMYNNALIGNIPAKLAEINYIRVIRFETNQISGYDSGAFANKPYLNSINLDNNLLPTSAVNQILIDVRDNVNQFKFGGTLNLAGTGNEAPTGDAGDPATGLGALYELQNAIAELGAVANWTVTTN